MQAQTYEASIQPAEELKLGDIWRFFFRRGWWIVAFSFLGLICGFLTTIRAQRMYTATTTVELNRDASSARNSRSLRTGLPSGRGPGVHADMLTHQAVLLNDNTALSVINHLDLMQTHPYVDISVARGGRAVSLDQDAQVRDRALGIFRGGLRVAVVKNTRLLTVSYTDTDPQRPVESPTLLSKRI